MNPTPLQVPPASDGRLDLEAVREKLAGKTGPAYWRTLEQVAGTEQFDAWMEDEFPNRASLLEIDRRSLLKFMGASMALAGLTGCRGVFLPEDKAVPWVKAPEELVPGKPLIYASVVTLAGYATGVLVRQDEGRPTKLEGNPEHPATGKGALDAISQAEILNLYDPDRTQNVIDQGDISSWERFFSMMRDKFAGLGRNGGAGLHVLVGNVTSPTEAALLNTLRSEYPGAGLHSYEPCGRDNVREGLRAVYGQPLEPVYDLSLATVVVSLDGDFLSPAAMPGSLHYARQFTDGRRVFGRDGRMNRLYVAESHVSLAGAMADHRFPMKPSEVYGAASALASALGVPGIAEGTAPGGMANALSALVKDLKENAGKAVVIAGEHHGPELHALAAQINGAIEAVGTTVRYVAPVSASVGFASLEALKADLDAGRVDTLLVLGGNPVYDAPASLDFATSLTKAKTVVHHGLNSDETARAATWSVPAAHELETWTDARAFDGTVSVAQPVLAPLYQGRSRIELLSTLLGGSTEGYAIVRQQYATLDETEWRRAVHDGLIAGSAAPQVAVGAPAGGAIPAPQTAGGGLEVSFLPDPHIFDGRYANNGWLQELPRPLTKMTWDNVVLLSPRDAQELGLVSDDKVRVTLDGRTVDGTAFVQPGQPIGAATIHLGFGRTAGGTLATVGLENDGDQGGGFNAYTLKSGRQASYGNLRVERVGGQRHIASTQGHSPLGGNRIPDERDVIREANLREFLDKGSPALIVGHAMDPEEIRENNLFPEKIYETNVAQWGMTIDMNTCIGCNACVTACQAENNISVVGKEQVGRNREMHWLRIDRYYSGTEENPNVTWQPIACVHCEKAPCEPVCPVAATVHSHEGLNQMVYNRCVGTRYCSNNCPYKVRRFNYLNYSDNQPMFAEKTGQNTRVVPGPLHEQKTQGRAMLKMINNPRVTVRGRGVMEKCTYCVQRINEARIESKKTNKDIEDGAIVTACEQACPAGAIVFGNIADKNSRVANLQKDPRSYLLLEELQTRPRTSHLAKLRNPNPEIA